MTVCRALAFAPLATVLGCTALNPDFGDDGQRQDPSGASGGQASGPTSGATSGKGSTGGGTSSASFGTDADTQAVSSTSGPPRLPVLFEDDEEAEFLAGEQVGSFTWTDESIQLDDASTGRFESRIFDAAQDTHWHTLGWRPLAAYGVALPDPSPDSWDADAYPRGAVDRAQMQLLMHLDEDDISSGAVLQDAAGMRPGRWSGEAPEQPRGVFGPGLENVGLNSRIDFDSAVEPGAGPFTWTLWFRGEGCNNSTLMALDAPPPTAVPGTNTAFMMCGFVDVDCPGLLQGGYLYAQVGDGVRACHTTRIDDGEWHHLALRRDAGDAVDVIVDGVVEPLSPSGTDVDLSVHEEVGQLAEVFTVASSNIDAFPGLGAYDEVALWNRGLADAEVQSLFLRGTQRITFEVRACDTPDCGDEDFVGPDGEEGNTFVDPGPGEGDRPHPTGSTRPLLPVRLQRRTPRRGALACARPRAGPRSARPGLIGAPHWPAQEREKRRRTNATARKTSAAGPRVPYPRTGAPASPAPTSSSRPWGACRAHRASTSCAAARAR